MRRRRAWAIERAWTIVCLVLALGGCHEPTPSLAPASTSVPAPADTASAATTVTPTAPAPLLALVETTPSDTALGFDTIPDTHAVWLEMVRGAQSRIDVGQFYISNGGRLEPIVDELERAAERGVRVRVLVDVLFLDKYPETIARLERGPVELAVTKAWREGGGIQHAKYLVVDARDAYLGSANFDWRSLEHIHELGVRIRSEPLAARLAALFDHDWDHAEAPASDPAAVFWPPVTVGDAEAQLVASPDEAWLGKAWELPHIERAIADAKRSVAVELLDYGPSFRDGRPFRRLDDALRAAAERGVKVRLILSHWQARHMDDVQALQRVPGCDVRIATVPEHDSGFIPFARVVHAKYLVVDGAWLWLGSSNWKGDYFLTGRNVGLVVSGGALPAQAQEVFEQLWASPYVADVDPERRYEAPRIGP